MTTATIIFFNAALHSLILAALGWLLVRWCIRDARRRGLAAQTALIFAIIAPWTLSLWPRPDQAKDAPALSMIHQALQPDWRIQVSTITAESTSAAVREIRAPLWDSNDVATGLHWLWAGGAALLLLRHFWLSFCLMQWRKSLRHATAEELASIPQGIDVSKLRVFDHAGTPCVAGVMSPVIAVPAAAFATQTATQWHWIMRHEEEHIRARDSGIFWLLGLIRALGWWNPFIHALIEIWARAREQVCDAAAVRNTQAPAVAYADFLLTVASVRQTPMNGVMPISQSKPARRLRARLEALMASRSVRDHAGWLFHGACLTAVVLGHALVASLGFISSAQAAEPAPSMSKPNAASGKMYTRAFRIPQGFGRDANIKKFLEARGVTFPDPAAVVLDTASTQLIVRNTWPNLERAEQIVEAAFGSSVQVVVSTKLIGAGRHWGKHGQVVAAPAADALIREISQTRGADLISSPTITAKLEQRAVAEITRQKDLQDDSKFLGFRVHLNAKKPMGEKIALETKVEIGFDMSRKNLLPSTEAEVQDWAQVQVFTADAEPLLAAGETAILHLTAGKRCITVLVTATALNSDGNPAGSFDRRAGN
jgi:beta-lactamase regulating signal transducer with metallopeptidase domain